MSAREHAYYEIALTGTQVVIALLAIVGMVLVAFFAGLQIGSGGAGGETVLASSEPPPANSAEDATEQEEAGSEFDFFADAESESPPPTLAELAEEPDPGTTLVEDVNGSPADDTDTESTVATAESEPSVAREEPEEPAAEGAVAEASGGLVIQVFSSDDKEQAREVAERLQAAGLPAYLVTSSIVGRTMHRVRIGPYESEAGAERVADRVRQEFRLDTWITSGG